jgi:hypothetical protein
MIESGASCDYFNKLSSDLRVDHAATEAAASEPAATKMHCTTAKTAVRSTAEPATTEPAVHATATATKSQEQRDMPRHLITTSLFPRCWTRQLLPKPW